MVLSVCVPAKGDDFLFDTGGWIIKLPKGFACLLVPCSWLFSKVSEFLRFLEVLRYPLMLMPSWNMSVMFSLTIPLELDPPSSLYSFFATLGWHILSR